jgi:hypothetical protein
MNNKEIPHNQISPKIISESRTNICKYWIPLTYKTLPLTLLVGPGTEIKCGVVKSALSVQTYSIWCKCFSHMNKMLILLYIWMNRVVVKNACVLIIQMLIFSHVQSIGQSRGFLPLCQLLMVM